MQYLSKQEFVGTMMFLFKGIATDFSINGILDIVFGYLLLVPLMGLFFPGARKLEQSNVALVLEKEDIAKK